MASSQARVQDRCAGLRSTLTTAAVMVVGITLTTTSDTREDPRVSLRRVRGTFRHANELGGMP